MRLFSKVTDYGDDFTTFSKTFDKYRWYKPILVFILMLIFVMAFIGIGFAVSKYLSFFTDMIPAHGKGMTSLETITASLLIALFSLLFFIAVKIVRYQPFSSFLTSRGEWRWDLIYKTFIICLPLFLVIFLIGGMISGGGSGVNSFTVLTLILCLVITPFQCLAEEIIYRGFILQTFGAWFKIPIVAIILSSIVFMFSHGYNSFGSISVLFTGIVLALMAWYTKGIEVSVVLHALNNVLLFLLAGFGLVTIGVNTPFDLFWDIFSTAFPVVVLFVIDWKWNWIGLRDK